MKKVLSKKFFIPFMALILCTAVAFGTAAVATQNNADIVVNVNASNTVKRNSETDEDAIYVGHGLNEWDLVFGPDAVNETGMSDAYFEVTAQRLIKTKPKMVRLMLVPYYMCYMDDEDGGEARWNAAEEGIDKAQLNFDSPYMYSIWRYLEVFQAAGTQVELNYGYKYPEPVNSWFSIKDVPETAASIAAYGTQVHSAPRNLQAFANNLAAFLLECKNRGFIGDTRAESTIQYINFYNEVNGSEYSTFGDKRAYWCKMLEYVHYALVDAGLRAEDSIGINNRNEHTVLIIGMESTTGLNFDTTLINFIDYVYENAYLKGYCEGFDTHHYIHYHNNPGFSDLEATSMSWANDRWKTNIQGSLNFLLAELQSCTCNFHQSMYNGKTRTGMATPYGGATVSQAIGASLGGAIGTLEWTYHASRYPRVVTMLNNNGLNKWNYPTNGTEIEKVSSTFGETCHFTRYVPANSKVAKSTVTSENNVTAVTYMNGDDTAIVLEVDYAAGFDYDKFEANNDVATRTVSISLDGRRAKKYYKYVYEFAESSFVDTDESQSQFDGNAIIPDAVAEFTTSKGVIEDTISGNHCLIVYSTIEPAKQVALTKSSRYIEYSLSKDKTNGVAIKVDTDACTRLDGAKFEYDVFRGVVDFYDADSKETQYLEDGFKAPALRKVYFKTDCDEYKLSSENGTTLNKRLGTVTKVNSTTARYRCATDESGKIIAQVGDTIAVRVKLAGDKNLLDSNTVTKTDTKLQVYDTDVYAIAIIKIVE